MKDCFKIMALALLLTGWAHAESNVDGVKVLTTLEELVSPEHTALIVVDMQNENVLSCGHYYADQPGWKRSNPIPEPPQISTHYKTTHDIHKLRGLIDAARKAGVTVIYFEFVFLNYDQSGIKLMYGPELLDSSRLERRWSMTCKELAPQKGELIVRKHHGNGFKETQLDHYLRSRSIRSLILTGTATNGCVLGSTWGAEMHGYYPVLVRDCLNHGTPEQREKARFDAPREDPPDKSPEAYYERCLSFMETRYPVVRAEEIMAAWGKTAHENNAKSTE